MRNKRKPYTINLDPTLIKALGAHILKEKKRVFKEDRISFMLRCWDRNFFIERAIKQLIKES